jgi:hypothetical protein
LKRQFTERIEKEYKPVQRPHKEKTSQKELF